MNDQPPPLGPSDAPPAPPPPVESTPPDPSPPAAAEPAAGEPTVVPDTARREQIRAQLLAASQLPRGMRESLAGSLPDLATSADPSGALVRVADVLTALQAAVPANWREQPTLATPEAHPAGEAFFTGDGPLTEQQASQIAREQLKRHGFLGA